MTNFYPSLGWIESAGGYFTAPVLQHHGFGGSSPENIYLGLSSFHLHGFLVLWFAFGHGLNSTLHRRHCSIFGMMAKRKRQTIKIQIYSTVCSLDLLATLSLLVFAFGDCKNKKYRTYHSVDLHLTRLFCWNFCLPDECRQLGAWMNTDVLPFGWTSHANLCN